MPRLRLRYKQAWCMHTLLPGTRGTALRIVNTTADCLPSSWANSDRTLPCWLPLCDVSRSCCDPAAFTEVFHFMNRRMPNDIFLRFLFQYSVIASVFGKRRLTALGQCTRRLDRQRDTNSLDDQFFTFPDKCVTWCLLHTLTGQGALLLG